MRWKSKIINNTDYFFCLLDYLLDFAWFSYLFFFNFFLPHTKHFYKILQERHLFNIIICYLGWKYNKALTWNVLIWTKMWREGRTIEIGRIKNFLFRIMNCESCMKKLFLLQFFTFYIESLQEKQSLVWSSNNYYYPEKNLTFLWTNSIRSDVKEKNLLLNLSLDTVILSFFLVYRTDCL